MQGKESIYLSLNGYYLIVLLCYRMSIIMSFLTAEVFFFSRFFLCHYLKYIWSTYRKNPSETPNCIGFEYLNTQNQQRFTHVLVNINRLVLGLHLAKPNIHVYTLAELSNQQRHCTSQRFLFLLIKTIFFICSCTVTVLYMEVDRHSTRIQQFTVKTANALKRYRETKLYKEMKHKDGRRQAGSATTLRFLKILQYARVQNVNIANISKGIFFLTS